MQVLYMTRIISITNQKGGCGKTTSVINISACLAQAGKKVLAVDIDPQCNLTSGLGVSLQKIKNSVYPLMLHPKKLSISDVIQKTKWKNLDILPSHIDLAGAEIELVNVYGRESLLSKILKPILNSYDFIIIDTPPSLSLLTVNALTASTEVFVCMMAHPFSLDALEKLYETIQLIKENLNPHLKLSGLIVTLFDTRTKLSKNVLDRLHNDKRIKNILFKTIIRANVKLAESSDKGVPVIYYDEKSHGAIAYTELAKEILKMKI